MKRIYATQAYLSTTKERAPIPLPAKAGSPLGAKFMGKALLSKEGQSEEDDLRKAVDVIKAFLRREFIVDDCRKAPCFGCASCEAVALELRLDALINTL